MARRFLFSSGAGYGHFHPLVPLASALERAGHEVAFTGTPALQKRMESTGFRFFLLDVDRTVEPEFQALKARLETMPLNLETEIYAYPRLFVGLGTRLTTHGLVDVCRSWQPDMVVREASAYAGVIAAEHMGIPHATVAIAAALRCMAVFEQEAADFLDPLRQAWGLPPDPGLVALYRNLLLSYSPPSFGTQELGERWGRCDIPDTTHFIRAAFYDASGNESLPDWVEHLPARPTVYLTLGTEVNKEPTLYPRVMQTIIEGLRAAPINLIVTLGRDKDPAEFGPQPENVRIERYIPQSALLPRCDLMVMHGGTNSMLQAVDAGVPTVIVPLIADQFFNAYVARDLQLAPVVPLEDLTPESIREAVEAALANPTYRRNMAGLKTEMEALPGIEHAVELVERVAAG
jgi:UDP:flavonoid glycosyltransferase YjiC (YdhE family)